MNFDNICNFIATKCLSKPGTIVECMNNDDGYWDKIEVGQLYEVILGGGRHLTFHASDGKPLRFCSRRFRIPPT